ncbi:FliO/MopB family protein [Sphingomonas nostoxanthinifaciens]|uniref:FliO/MopB family protein n=1 Tax=Sphingomonas nostoxanthinifaciens TaxID=2872652 RepID=UPI001CC1C81F|nr:flagellar biosynthetic protein FliO [Sphingomonas nostoxanthinifaciens]UAK26026.1 flagellar biosynthetic protein FliO [Sphingomonas nostoxanthinifaciens]
MTAYLLQLVLMIALVGGLAVLALWLYRRLQPGMAFGSRERALRIIDAQPMGPMSRLAVVEFAGKRYLIAVSRGRVDRIAEADAPNFVVPDA